MTNYFIIPGLGGSGPEHWQTYFEKLGDNFHRIKQKDWDAPNIAEWAANIDKAITGYDPESVVLVAHSLGCPTLAFWANQYQRKIKGALLVAPPDIEKVHVKLNKTLFKTFPSAKIKFKTIVVASTNDHWATIKKAEYYATNWGSEFVNIGDAGHINDLSGFGDWQQGQGILKRLA